MQALFEKGGAMRMRVCDVRGWMTPVTLGTGGRRKGKGEGGRPARGFASVPPSPPPPSPSQTESPGVPPRGARVPTRYSLPGNKATPDSQHLGPVCWRMAWRRRRSMSLSARHSRDIWGKENVREVCFTQHKNGAQLNRRDGLAINGTVANSQ